MDRRFCCVWLSVESLSHCRRRCGTARSANATNSDRRPAFRAWADPRSQKTAGTLTTKPTPASQKKPAAIDKRRGRALERKVACAILYGETALSRLHTYQRTNDDLQPAGSGARAT